jgi:hypothetical protein
MYFDPITDLQQVQLQQLAQRLLGARTRDLFR